MPFKELWKQEMYQACLHTLEISQLGGALWRPGTLTLPWSARGY